MYLDAGILQTVLVLMWYNNKLWHVRRYRFGWNFDSKFYVRKKIYCAMGESGCGFGLEVMRKIKIKLFKRKTKKIKIIEYDGS